MVGITSFICESEWNPSLQSHTKAYNSLVKWVNTVSKSLDTDEVIDLLKSMIDDIENDDVQEISK